VKRFNSICMITENVPALRDFYCRVLQTSAEGDDAFTALSTEGAQLTLFHPRGMEQMAPGSMAGSGHSSYALEFEVQDVDREYERLRELGVPIVKPPTTQAWGLRSAWFRDPDGNIVNFYAPVDRVRPADASAMVREYLDRLLNRRDLSACDEFLSAGYRDHDAPPGTPPGPQSIRSYVAGFLDQYPDMWVELADAFAEGSRVAVRAVWHGHHRETGETYHQMGLVIFRIDDHGQIAERWSAYTPLFGE
jgi:catechol 2,3-dioxygenase-like lactoylglutathione lyase family enzyme/predicted SnoaL-like aldol condensation-catalyzing enzyme